MTPKELIAENRLDEALEALVGTLPAHLHNEAILLQGRLNRLNADNRLGVLPAAEAGQERNRIAQAALELCDRVPVAGNITLTKNITIPADYSGNPLEIVQTIDGGGSDGPLRFSNVVRAPAKKILFVAANPGDTARLQTDREHKAIQDEMERGTHRDRYAFLQPQLAVTIGDLLRALNDKPQIVHFAGHGEEGGLHISTEQNRLQLVPEAALVRLFQPHKDEIEFVLFNACYSFKQAEALSALGFYVVGFNQAIGDMAAIGFAKGLYNGLGEGKAFEAALNDALIILMVEHPEYAAAVEVWKDGAKVAV